MKVGSWMIGSGMLREPQHDSMGDVWESSRYTSLRSALEVAGVIVSASLYFFFGKYLK